MIGEYEIWLVGIDEEPPEHLDVFVDLTGMRENRLIPEKYKKYLPVDGPDIITWKITDGRIDYDIAWFILPMLEDGLKVGFGCHGAHGRTGWLAAKLHTIITGSSGDEAVAWIRKEFCEKAVETEMQIKDLGCVHEKGSWPSVVTVGFNYNSNFNTIGGDFE